MIAEEDAGEMLNSPEAPDLPLPVQDGEPMDADITITRRGEKTIHERENRLDSFKAKIKPIMGRSIKDEEFTTIINLKKIKLGCFAVKKR